MISLPPLDAISQVLEEDYELNSLQFSLRFMDEDCEALVNKYFALIHFNDDEFYLSFCLNSSTLFDACAYTQSLIPLLQDKLIPYIDHYVDVENGYMYFGDVAHTKYKEMLNTLKGLKQCPVCDRVLPKELYKTDTGICSICENITLKKATYH
jgi:hypothetical protein